MADLKRKSIEPIALAAGVPERTLQEFLAFFDWDEQRIHRLLQQLVMPSPWVGEGEKERGRRETTVETVGYDRASLTGRGSRTRAALQVHALIGPALALGCGTVATTPRLLRCANAKTGARTSGCRPRRV